MKLNKSISQRTSLLLIKDGKVLLGYKKRGFGQGKYLGIGGKNEDGESLEETAAREANEEVSIKEPRMHKVGDLTFLFPERPKWNQEVHVYIANSWVGEPQESDEIKPYWFGYDKLPLGEMWDDAQFWLPAILNNHSLRGEFVYNFDLKVIRVQLKEEVY